MLEFLLIFVGVAGVAISIIAKFVFAHRCRISPGDSSNAADVKRHATLLSKPGRIEADRP